MTRWAKSGNTQKHQKMPEDPTPWEELSKTVKKLKKESLKSKKYKTVEIKCMEKSKAQPDVNNHFIDENKVYTQELEKHTDIVNKKQLKKLNLKNKEKQKVKLNTAFIDDSNVDNKNNYHECDINDNLTENSEEAFSTENDEIVEKSNLTKRQLKQVKLKKSKKQRLVSNTELSDQFDEVSSLEKETEISVSKTSEDGSQNFVDQKNGLITGKHVSKKQLKKFKLENKMKRDTTSNLESFNQVANENSDCMNNLKTVTQLSSGKKNSKKKELFLKKLQKKRAENGITLLSPKMERKLYMIKKRLREKGFTPEMIKDIIRKERRKAELALRKPSVNKTCFNCRQLGHVLADCPHPASSGSTPETGICFKCGSTEHTSYRCRKNISGYPFATCFICKKSGHISKDCPDNPHGVYIKGGKCNLCGNVNHFRKDCPSLNKKEEELPSASAHTIFEGASIDDEITEFKGVPAKKKKIKKTKIVKF